MIEFDPDAYLARIAEADRARAALLAEINALGFASFSALTTADMERLANEYATRELAKYDEPSLSDIEVHERFLGIDDAEARALFDERLIMKRAGIEIDEPWNDHHSDPRLVTLALYGWQAAERRNPAPEQPLVPPPGYVNDPTYEASFKKAEAKIEYEMFSRDALRHRFYSERRDELLSAQRDEQRAQEQLDARRALLATPVVLEGELIPARRRR